MVAFFTTSSHFSEDSAELQQLQKEACLVLIELRQNSDVESWTSAIDHMQHEIFGGFGWVFLGLQTLDEFAVNQNGLGWKGP